MTFYKDRTFCPFWLICKNGHTCDRAFTQAIKDDAERWWGEPDAPICVYGEFPECFVPWFEEKSKK